MKLYYSYGVALATVFGTVGCGTLMLNKNPKAPQFDQATGVQVGRWFNSTTTSPVLSWPLVKLSGATILRFELSIGLTSGGTEILPWTSIGGSTTFQATGLALADGGTYYANVRAIDGNQTVYPVSPSRSWTVRVSGAGAFQNHVEYATSDSNPRFVTLMDINNDGILDLVGGYTNINSYLGKGDGTFQSGVNQGPSGQNGQEIAVADFNHDGIMDAAIIPYNPAPPCWIEVFLGNGSGGFQASPVQYFYGGGSSAGTSIATGDFNHDGNVDLVVTDFGASAACVFLGVGNGTFGASTCFPVGTNPKKVLALDLNGDGLLDIVTTNQVGNSISVLIGRGDGTFQPMVNYPTLNLPYGIASGDFNGDGKIDLAVADNGSASMSIFYGNGDGTFQTKVDIAVGTNPYSVSTADMNGDGKPDLVVTNSGSNNIGVLLGNLDGSFQPMVTYGTVASSQPYRTVLSDLNHDGIIDIVVTNRGVSSLSVLLGK